MERRNSFRENELELEKRKNYASWETALFVIDSIFYLASTAIGMTVTTNERTHTLYKG